MWKPVIIPASYLLFFFLVKIFNIPNMLQYMHESNNMTSQVTLCRVIVYFKSHIFFINAGITKWVF